MNKITDILAGEKESKITEHIITIGVLIALLFGCCLCYEKYYKSVHDNYDYVRTSEQQELN